MHRNRLRLTLAAALGVFVMTAPAAWAHHAFTAEFDANRKVKVIGAISKLDWLNPHAWIHVNVTDKEGRVEEWAFELPAPAALTRRGFTRDYLKPGTPIEVEGFLSKAIPRRANGRIMKYTTGPRAGQELFVGSSGTGAPQDGADPSER